MGEFGPEPTGAEFGGINEEGRGKEPLSLVGVRLRAPGTRGEEGRRAALRNMAVSG